jgi:serine/threonine-protein kinase
MPRRKRGNVVQFPLGPRFAGNPHNDHAFEHDGTASLFTLPNGLVGYFLTDGKDRAVNRSPVEILRDRQETAGTVAVVNGLSCLACHSRGIVDLPGEDVRLGTTLTGEARRKVQQLHPARDELDEKVAEDQKSFLAALKKTVDPFLSPGDRDRLVEPISDLARNVYNPDVTLERAAYELGLEEPAVLKKRIESSEKLGKLGLSTLPNDGVIARTEWERVGATSLFQRTARELGLGVPWRMVR